MHGAGVDGMEKKCINGNFVGISNLPIKKLWGLSIYFLCELCVPLAFKPLQDEGFKGSISVIILFKHSLYAK